MNNKIIYRMKENYKAEFGDTLYKGDIVHLTGYNKISKCPIRASIISYVEVYRKLTPLKCFVPYDLIEEIHEQESVDSTSTHRVVNNVMRHEYRVLSEAEKTQMQTIKDLGLEFFDYIETIGNSRELSLAKTKVEEAVMWAVKHITK